jgi:hypothetical protein
VPMIERMRFKVACFESAMEHDWKSRNERDLPFRAWEDG